MSSFYYFCLQVFVNYYLKVSQHDQFSEYEAQRLEAQSFNLEQIKLLCALYEQSHRTQNPTSEHFNEKEYIIYYQHSRAIETITRIEKGCRIEHINWYTTLSRPHIVEGKAYNIYDFKILCFIVNATGKTANKLAIIDSVLSQLQLEDYDPNNINAESFLNYLPHYKSNISYQQHALKVQPKCNHYAIPTNFTTARLQNIFQELKNEGFIAPEQQLSDFLNAFNSNSTTQGKILWIKRSHTSHTVARTAILDFVNQVGECLYHPDREDIIRNIFGITLKPYDIPRFFNNSTPCCSEFHNALQRIIQSDL